MYETGVSECSIVVTHTISGLFIRLSLKLLSLKNDVRRFHELLCYIRNFFATSFIFESECTSAVEYLRDRTAVLFSEPKINLADQSNKAKARHHTHFLSEDSLVTSSCGLNLYRSIKGGGLATAGLRFYSPGDCSLEHQVSVVRRRRERDKQTDWETLNS